MKAMRQQGSRWSGFVMGLNDGSRASKRARERARERERERQQGREFRLCDGVSELIVTSK